MALTPALAEALGRAGTFLDALVADLYRCSDGRSHLVRPLPAIDDPAVAAHVLAHPDVFVKNYAFLEALGDGRFTANGAAWRDRAALTRDWYGAPPASLDVERLAVLYARHLRGDSPAGSVLDGDRLHRRLVAAALEVFSITIGLPTALDWPADSRDTLGELLRIRQWIDWEGCPPALLAEVQRGLEAARDDLRERWHRDPASHRLLTSLARAGRAIDGFDAVAELLQNAIASSETTASSLLWIADALSREPAGSAGWRGRLAQPSGDADAAGFVDEVLRLHPPVPLLTRRCVVDHRHGALEWAAGSVLAISIVGLQRRPVVPGGHAGAPEPSGSRGGGSAGAAHQAFMPFSRGARACAGRRLASLELAAGFRALLAELELRPGDAPTRPAFGLASRPRTALRAVLRSA